MKSLETKAKIVDVSKDIKTGCLKLTFLCRNVNPTELDRFYEKDLRLKVVQWKEKRSLEANGYLWALLDKIAGELQSTKEEVYEIMLQRYGTLLIDDESDKPYTVTVSSALDMSIVEGHYLKLKESKDGKFSAYAIIKGSSEYDTAEMSRLINGVVNEAKQLGIETMPPDELKRMISQWNPS